jgi:hypothetical protein
MVAIVVAIVAASAIMAISTVTVVVFATAPVAELAVAVPMMVVLEAPTRAIPVACEVARALITGGRPYRSGIGRLSPIAGMPVIAVSDRIPITLNPEESRARGSRLHGISAGRRRRSDLNTDGDLGTQHTRESEKEKR